MLSNVVIPPLGYVRASSSSITGTASMLSSQNRAWFLKLTG